jgi:hypothetical protein
LTGKKECYLINTKKDSWLVKHPYKNLLQTRKMLYSYPLWMEMLTSSKLPAQGHKLLTSEEHGVLCFQEVYPVQNTFNIWKKTCLTSGALHPLNLQRGEAKLEDQIWASMKHQTDEAAAWTHDIAHSCNTELQPSKIH